MATKISFIFWILFELTCHSNAVDKTKPGWFARDRNYTDYCHGGDFESGISERTKGNACAIWLSNESRCMLRLINCGVNENFGIAPPKEIKPNDCGVFWSEGAHFKQTNGWVHYMCDEYGVIVALEWGIPFAKRNTFGTRLVFFNRATHHQLLAIEHEGSSTGSVVSMNVFVSETKRFCPCDDPSILEKNFRRH